MASCSYCDSFILFGGRTDGTGRYCNEKCQQAGNLLAISQQIPQRELERLYDEIRHQNCPCCGSPGTLEMHKAYKVWSALVLTSWSSSPRLSCKSCATKRQLGSILFSGVFGWWGFPWGLIMTPIVIARNIAEMATSPKSDQPSPLLQKFVRLQAAVNFLQQSRSRNTGPVPPRIPSSNARSTPPPIPDDDERYIPKAQSVAPSR